MHKTLYAALSTLREALRGFGWAIAEASRFEKLIGDCEKLFGMPESERQAWEIANRVSCFTIYTALELRASLRYLPEYWDVTKKERRLLELAGESVELNQSIVDIASCRYR